MIVYVTLWMSNIYCILNNRNNRFISLLTWVFLGSVFVSNEGMFGDAYNYRMDFEQQVFSDNWAEIGYSFLKKMLYQIGVNRYFGLLMAIFLFSILFILIGLVKFNVSFHAVTVMIMPFIFPTVATAIRFFMALSIMVLGLWVLINRKYTLYVLLVISATLLHRISLFYLLFILCASNRGMSSNANQKLWTRMVAAFSILSVIITFISGSVPFIDSLIKYATLIFSNIDVKATVYTMSITRYGAFIFFIIYFSSLLFAHMARKKIHITCYSDGERDDTMAVDIHKMADMNLNINLILSVALPFIALNLVFYRLLIIGFISDAILFGMYMKKINPAKTRMSFLVNSITVCFMITCLLWFIPEIVGINDISIKGVLDASFLKFF